MVKVGLLLNIYKTSEGYPSSSCSTDSKSAPDKPETALSMPLTKAFKSAKTLVYRGLTGKIYCTGT